MQNGKKSNLLFGIHDWGLIILRAELIQCEAGRPFSGDQKSKKQTGS